MIRTKLQKEAVEKFIRWAIINLEGEHSRARSKKQKDEAQEMLFGLCLICDVSDLGDLFEKLKKEIVL